MRNLEQLQFQGQAQSREFRPVEQASPTKLIEENTNRLLRAQDRNLTFYNETADRAGAIELNNRRQDWVALSKMSETLSNYITKVAEQTQKDIEDGAIYDEFMRGFGDGEDSPQTPEQIANDKAEADVINNANTQGDQAARFAYEVEQGTNNPVMGNMAWQRTGGLAQGVRGEEALLIRARAGYNGWMQAWMLSNNSIKVNGQSIGVAEAMASGDPALVSAAIAAGRFRYIRDNGLQHATRRNFVKFMVESMYATEGAISGQAVLGAIKAQREERTSQIEGMGYDLAQTTDASNVGSAFETLSRQFFQGNLGMSRGAANEAAVKSLIQGFEDSGNTDALNALLDVQQVPGQAGTELRRRYGNLINDALRRAEGRKDDIDARSAKDIESGMYEELAGATTQQQRDAIIQRAAQQLEASGLYQQAHRLRQERDELSVSGSNELNTARLEEGLRTGAISATEVEQARLRGDITPQQAERLTRDFGGSGGAAAREDLKNPLFKGTADSWGDRAENDFLNRVGLKKDQFGRILPGGNTAITDGEAEIIRQQMRNDINRITQATLQTTQGASDSEKQKALHTALKEWYDSQVKSEGGKYYVAPPTGNGSIPVWNPQNRQYLKNLANSPGVLSRGYAPPSITPKDWSGSVTGTTVPQSVVRNFRRLRGDKLFDADVVKNLKDSYEKSGEFQKGLQAVAQRMGMSPLALLNQQIAAHGLEPVRSQSLDLQSSSSGAPASGVRGANTLMSLGFPARGAAWLAGNIQQESQWNGQRQPWDDGGALSGGLISWRAGRLQNAEAALGGDISRASNQAQLRYMVEEMRTKYPSAYRVFMNPRSTDRQLIRASQQFWGYGVEGNRFGYARDIESNVNRRGRQQSTATGTAQQRTIQVGRYLLSTGYKVWQHANFDLDRGFVAGGGARVGSHAPNSHHNYGEALDIPLSHNSEAKLDKLYNYLNKHRQRLGIRELLWRVPGHNTHLHVAFG